MKNQDVDLEKVRGLLWEAIDSIKEHKRKEWDDDEDLIEALDYLKEALINLGDTEVG